MQSPIFGFDVRSRWDQCGEVPIVSTFTSVVRFAKGVLCGLRDVARGDGNALTRDGRDIGRAICEVIPIVNMIAAYYFNRSDQIDKFSNNEQDTIRQNIKALKDLIEGGTAVSANKKTLALWEAALAKSSGERTD